MRSTESAIISSYPTSVSGIIVLLTLEGIRGGGGGGGRREQSDSSIFLALSFYSLTDYQKLWHNCSLFVKTSFDFN